MALTFDFSKIKDWENQASDLKQIMPVACMITGMGKITEKNWEKFARRLTFVQKIHGGYRHGGGFVTKEDVHGFIGLSTNACYKDETQLAFIKRHTEHLSL